MLKRRILILIDALFIITAFSIKDIALLAVLHFPQCIGARLGFLCPSCNGTSCVYNFAIGKFSEAFALHPIVFLSMIYIIAVLVILNIACLSKHKKAEMLFKKMVSPAVVIVYAIVFSIFGIIRNFI